MTLHHACLWYLVSIPICKGLLDFFFPPFVIICPLSSSMCRYLNGGRYALGTKNVILSPGIMPSICLIKVTHRIALCNKWPFEWCIPRCSCTTFGLLHSNNALKFMNALLLRHPPPSLQCKFLLC